MAELKISWDDFRQAALNELSSRYPNISLNKDDNTRFVRIISYEGECECYDIPQIVYIKLED